MGLIEKKSFCRVCGSACGIIVELDGDRVVKVRGDEDHPITRGYTCPKGRNLAADHAREDRLEVPLMRVGDQLEATNWDSLLDDLAARLRTILDESGPRAIGLFTGGGGYLDCSGHMSSMAFAQVLQTPSNYSDMTIDNVPKVLIPELMAGIPGLMSRADTARCNMMIFMGTNPVISHGHTWTLNSPTAALRDITGRGAEVWVIDPRRTETAQRSTRYLASRPGMDYVVLGFLIRELLEDGADRAFIEQHTQGVQQLREAVTRFTAARASALSGISEEELGELLAAVRRNGQVSVDTGTGVTMSRAGNMTQWLSWALMLITGSLDREGGAWIHPGAISRMDKMDIPAAPESGWGQPGPDSRPDLPSVAGNYPCAAIPDEIAAGNLRAMVVFGGNIEPCLPETGRTYDALKQLEVLATFDVRPTRTTDISTHVMPGKHQLERSDLTYVTESYFQLLSTQYTPPMVPVVGDRKGVWWVIGQLGKRMGIDFFPGLDVDTADDETVVDYITGRSPMTFEGLRENRMVNREPVIGWMEDYVDAKIGGWRLAPPSLVAQLKDFEGWESEQKPGDLVLIPRRQKYHENSKMLDLRDKPHVFLNPQDAESGGFAEGELVEVRSANGFLRGTVKIDASLRQGALNVPHGWSDEFNVNRLTGTRECDPLTGMVLYSGLPVSLHALAKTG